jgi:F0F1-type ATP synthase assembly protein I
LILSMPLYFRGIQLDWLGKAMLGISILTLPHTVVVCLMDRFQLRNARAKGN